MNTHTAPRIGVFDSGVGGLSVLRVLRRRLPHASLHYVADSGHAPYGERSQEFVQQRSLRIARHLFDNGAQAVVMACNTATALAIDGLRRNFGPTALIGVEPGIKPALVASGSGRIGVMATLATLRSERFRALLGAHAGSATLTLQACTGLAAAIERGELDDPRLSQLVQQHCGPLRAAGVDTVVLGCTHYPFAESLIRQAMGLDVALIDTADAVTRRVEQLIAAQTQACGWQPLPQATLLQTSGSVSRLSRWATRWLSFDCRVEPLPGEV